APRAAARHARHAGSAVRRKSGCRVHRSRRPDFAAEPGARLRRDAPQRGRKPDGRRGAGAPDCPVDAGRIQSAAIARHVRAMTRSRWAALGDVYVAAPLAPSHRSFGLTVGSVLAALAAFTLWRGHALRAEVLGTLGGA